MNWIKITMNILLQNIKNKDKQTLPKPDFSEQIINFFSDTFQGLIPENEI